MKRKTYKAYLIDLDGTLYYGKKRIKTAENFVRKLIIKKIPFLILTNNATRSAETVAQDLRKHYDLPVSSHHIYTSAMAMVTLLKKEYAQKRVHVVGEAPFKKLIENQGIPIYEADQAQILVQALDRQIDYSALAKAADILRRGGDFLVTNQDRAIPTQDGFIPSAGALTAFLSFTTGVEPRVIGKPYLPILKGALQVLGMSKDEVLIIGDNVETDIWLGLKHGVDTLLVLTGVTKEKDLINLPQQPTYICHDLSEWEVE